jgi:hypothetical protein
MQSISEVIKEVVESIRRKALRCDDCDKPNARWYYDGVHKYCKECEIKNELLEEQFKDKALEGEVSPLDEERLGGAR